MKTIAVLGLGKVGALAALLLHRAGFEVTGYDRELPAHPQPYTHSELDVTDKDALGAVLKKSDGVLSCLPYHFNRAVAETAHEAGIHYFDLTEDVATTQAIAEMANTSRGLMAPQCGLAPGFVGIVSASLIAMFDECRSCRMRVGALPQNPTGLMGYAFNWSPEGVVNEYLNDCEVLEEGEHKWVSPMEWLETIYIDGVHLEAFTTSGGLGTMCQTYKDIVPNLDYKSMRYPGHMQMMNFFFHELLMRERREEAGEILVHAKPPVNDDVVYIHVAAEGTIKGRVQRKEFVRSYRPLTIDDRTCTAIAWTTSASVVAVIELVKDGKLPAKGFLKQEDIPLEDFMRTDTGSLYRAQD